MHPTVFYSSLFYTALFCSTLYPSNPPSLSNLPHLTYLLYQIDLIYLSIFSIVI